MPVVGVFRAFVTFVNLWQSWQNSVAIVFPSPSGNSTTGFGCDGEAGAMLPDRYPEAEFHFALDSSWARPKQRFPESTQEK